MLGGSAGISLNGARADSKVEDGEESGPLSNSKPASGGYGRRPAAETIQAFIATAQDLFAERGYNGTSISDIVKAMGLTTASLYYHISSKQELLYKVLTTGIAPWVEQLEKINATDLDPMKKLRLAVENHLSFVLDNPNGVIVFQRERRFLGAPYKDNYLKQINRYDELFTEIIEAGMPGGVTGDPRLMRLAILGMINWTAEWYNPEGRLGADDIRRAFSEIVMDRILASDDPTK